MVEFLPHQKRSYVAATSGGYRECWDYGAIRTGKSTPKGASLVRRMLAAPGDYFCTNSTAANVWAVQYPLIRAYAQKAGVRAYRGREEAAVFIGVGKSRAWVAGLKNAGSHDPFMGRTTRGGWYEEVNLCNQEAFDMLLGRGSLKGAVHDIALNPDGPKHWTKEYIDDAENRRAWVQQTKLTDNTFLDSEYVAYLESIYTLPHLRRRYIEGEFAAGEGLVYQCVPDADECSHRGRLGVAADPGASGVTAAVYARQQPGGNWVVFDEYYYDARQRGQIGEAAHAKAIIEKHGIPDTLVCDPGGGNLRYEFSQIGAYARTADKEIVDGIRHLDSVFRAERLAILSGSCPNTRDELATLEWDDKARERGEDMPVEGNDHAADCLRYLARAVIPRYGRIVENPGV